MKNLIISFSSFVIPRDPLKYRMEEYAICYEQLKRIVPSNFEILFVDNTIKSEEEITNNRLSKALENCSRLFYNNNIGLENKGIGELQMLLAAQNTLNFSSYKNIIYLTGRRFITCPYVFNRAEKCELEILVGNQPIFNPFNGLQYPSGVDMFGDMFFSMSSSKMLEYCLYVNGVLSKQRPINIGSEQILYSFIKNNNYKYEEIRHLGFIRNDWEMVNPSTYSRRVENFQVI